MPRIQTIKAAGIELVLAGASTPLDKITEALAKLDKTSTEQQVILKLTRDELVILTARVAALERGEALADAGGQWRRDFTAFVQVNRAAFIEEEPVLLQLDEQLDRCDASLEQSRDARIAATAAVDAFKVQLDALNT